MVLCDKARGKEREKTEGEERERQIVMLGTYCASDCL
jgi:hypothetical protein